MPRLSGKHILLGVSGGIAAYKSCDLASRLVKEGARVTAVLTRGARRFITPYAFEALTGYRVTLAGEWDVAEGDPRYADHSISLVALLPKRGG